MCCVSVLQQQLRHLFVSQLFVTGEASPRVCGNYDGNLLSLLTDIIQLWLNKIITGRHVDATTHTFVFTKCVWIKTETPSKLRCDRSLVCYGWFGSLFVSSLYLKCSFQPTETWAAPEKCCRNSSKHLSVLLQQLTSHTASLSQQIVIN